MKKILQEQFALKKVKKINGGGLEINYEIEDVIGQEIFYDESTKKSSKEPHPDLIELLNILTPTVAVILRLGAISEVINEKAFKATKPQKEFAEKAKLTMFQSVRTNGISLFGKAENRGCKILAIYQPDNQQALAVNPQVRFNTDKYGFEEEVDEITSRLEAECYLYLFEGKRGQLEMFNDNNENDESDKPDLFDAKSAAANDK